MDFRVQGLCSQLFAQTGPMLKQPPLESNFGSLNLTGPWAQEFFTESFVAPEWSLWKVATGSAQQDMHGFPHAGGSVSNFVPASDPC